MATKRQPAASRPASEPRKPVDVRKVAETPQRLDRLIHDRARLGIVSALAAQSPLSFSELKSLLEMTDGNLSVHARKLEEAGYIACEKGFEGRVPRTEFSLTGEGRRALQTYLDHMESLIKAMKKG
ncbi:MAG: transcriptional regulator [Thermoanaerobaculia bacterium]|nr:transcriptional regulator [Thermoanaerobaculia bacterium]